MSKHSPTPWKASEWRNTNSDEVAIHAADGTWVADAVIDHDSESATADLPKANAEHIVRCVNSHDELARALHDLVGDLHHRALRRYLHTPVVAAAEAALARLEAYKNAAADA